jgi:hypothetical protein
MGTNQSIQKCNFEDIQNNIYKKNKFILINTLPHDNQDCLITGTISIDKEESIINSLLNIRDIIIFIYGKNCNDQTIYKKYIQLNSLGFTNIFVYCGGLFEWLCLQDIFGDDEFPTTKKEIDILKYKGISDYNKLYITN